MFSVGQGLREVMQRDTSVYLVLTTDLFGEGIIPMLELTEFSKVTPLVGGRVRTWTLVCLLPGVPLSWQMSTWMDECHSPLQSSGFISLSSRPKEEEENQSSWRCFLPPSSLIHPSEWDFRQNLRGHLRIWSRVPICAEWLLWIIFSVLAHKWRIAKQMEVYFSHLSSERSF